jgi:iron complex outermembrane receptor protein
VDFPDGLIGKPDLVERNLALAATTSYEGWPNQRLRIGAGVQRNEASTNEAKNFGPGVIDGTVSPIGGGLTDVSNTANKFMLDTGRTLVYALLQDEWQMRRDLALTAGLRYDHYSDFGSTVNPRLALVWETSDRLTSKLLYGQAFRAPSFVELYAVNNPAYLGNRKNVPETIKTLELAFDYQPVDTLRTALNLFGYETKDNIEFRADPAPATTISAQNIKGQRGHGFELEGEWRPYPAVQLRANYAWQHSELRATGQRVADAPGQSAFLDARWKFLPGWTAGAQVNRVADRKRVAGDTRDAIADYTTVDMTLRHQFIAQDMELAASVRNAFNADAREPGNGTIPGDYPLEKRSFYLELKYMLDAPSAKP